MDDTVDFGSQRVPRAQKASAVGDVFRRVAARYDLMNDLMSGGLHRGWKDLFVRQVRPRAGEDILDMAGGTGDVAFRLARAGAHVTVADINPAMLEVGMRRATRAGLEGLIWTEENAEALTLSSAAFDAYTIAFGIRNVTDIPAALREAHRVLRFGGRFFCLEFSQVEWPGFGTAYRRYSDSVVPRIGKLVARDEAAYRYLVDSIARFPAMPAFAAMIEAAGFARVSARPVLGGLVAIHSGWKV